MKKEYLATRLLSGRLEGPPKTLWWIRHCRAIMKHLAVIDRSEAEIISSCEDLTIGASAWDADAGKAFGRELMKKHASLEIALVSAATKRNSEEITRIGEILYDNADSQTRVYSAAFVSFPEITFLHLFEEHIALFS